MKVTFQKDEDDKEETLTKDLTASTPSTTAAKEADPCPADGI